MPEVEGVQFHESKPISISEDELQTPAMVRWIMKFSGGYIKTSSQAALFLLGFSFAAIIVSLYLFFSGNTAPKTPPDERVFPRLQEPIT